MEGKEELEVKERADYNAQQTDRSPFDILDEVEGEGDFSLADIADEAEAEYEKERVKAEGDDEETGLKADKKAEEEEEAEKKEGEEEGETEKKETTEDKKAEEEEEAEKKEETEDVKQPEWLLKKLKDINPELDTDSEEDVQKAIDDMAESREQLDQAKKDLESEKEANKSFYTLLEGSDDLREVARFMHKHSVDFGAALTALEIEPQIDMEELKTKDPDAYLDAVKAREQREKAAKEEADKRQERESVIAKNAEMSVKNTEAFKKDNELDSRAFEELTEFINPEIEKLADGLVTKSFYDIVFKAKRFDQAVDQAYQKGLTEGRNTKIDEQKRRKAGDNLPRLEVSAHKRAEKEEDDIFSEALKPEPRISDIK